jgi:ABC-type multidrug transport system fused ATPase/permease subunit
VLNNDKNDMFFQKKLFEYNKPIINILVGIIFQMVNGCLGPVFGWWIIKLMFAMLYFSPNADEENQAAIDAGTPEFAVLYDVEKLKSEMQFWLLFMVGGAVLSFFLNLVSKFAFGRVGENITLRVRQTLYEAILVKQVGWHDHPENASGIMSSLLAQDVQTLNSVSTEMVAVTMEAMASMIGGIVIAFIFTWQVALVALAIAPFMMAGGIIGAKIDAQNAGNDEVSITEKKEKDAASRTGANDPNLLANDAINNFRTITGFSLNKGIIEQYSKLLEPELKSSQNAAHCAGVIFGYSKFIENACIGIILYFGTLIMTKVDGLDGEKVFVAVFAIVFGAFGAGQASAYGPDASKGKRAAVKIFKVTETPSEIDAMHPK